MNLPVEIRPPAPRRQTLTSIVTGLLTQPKSHALELIALAALAAVIAMVSISASVPAFLSSIR